MKKMRIVKGPQERKQEIVEAALELFSQKGYEHTTIQDIAEKLNISQGLCYRYFSSKSDIFMAAAEYYAQQVIKQITAPFPDDMCAVDKFNLMIKRMFKYIVLHSTFVEDDKLIQFRATRFSNTSEQIVSVLIPIIEQGNEEGIFNCPNAKEITRILVFGTTYSFHRDISELDKQDIKGFIKNFLQILKQLFVPVLGIKDEKLLGQGWNDIL